MGQKIGSEIKYSDKSFKLKIGTMNKKNPDVVYVSLGAYIIPTTEKNNWGDEVKSMDKSIRRYIRETFSNSDVFGKDFISVMELANESVQKGRKSYLDVQLFLKPTKSYLASNNLDFKKLSDDLYTKYIPDITSHLVKNIEDNGFNLTVVP